MLTQEQWQRRADRERSARKAAEQFLESKSRELYDANIALAKSAETLEAQVVERTAELQAAVVAADNANAAKSRFLARISHELRTPLNGIVSMIALAQDEEIPASAAEYMTFAARSSRHLLKIINDLLDLSQLTEGKAEKVIKSFDLSELVEEVQALAGVGATQKGLSFPVRLHFEGSPEFERGHFLCVSDPLRIRQILENLVNNAIKFTRTGTVELTVLAKVDSLNIQVADTGIGIAEDQVARLFTPFEQARDDYAREQEGTGLGLAIVNELTQLLGGQVQVISELGAGSRFTVSLPVKFEAARVVPQSAALPDGRAYSVLVVDDSVTNRLSIKLLLERKGWDVVTADDGAGALTRARERLAATAADPDQNPAFQAVLMDISMPRMDGIEATRHLRAGVLVATDCPVIALTAHAMPEVEGELLTAGMDALLSKPVDPARLHQQIAEIIEGHAQSPQD